MRIKKSYKGVGIALNKYRIARTSYDEGSRELECNLPRDQMIEVK